ncbi:MAG: 6-carboxytetrahydropterin synthase QueD [Candidatus Cloacimonetes bacterium]|nr:6-carboxytetrahydropterin synthase QueD [Candidatus Cloacimonadota bacterium]
MYRINVKSDFSSAHQLHGYDGACRNMHGHNWKVRLEIMCSEVDEIGMAMDFNEVKIYLREMMERLDHKVLNELEPFNQVNPTSENIAKWLFEEFERRINIPGRSVTEVEIWESEKSSVIYSK